MALRTSSPECACCAVGGEWTNPNNFVIMHSLHNIGHDILCFQAHYFFYFYYFIKAFFF